MSAKIMETQPESGTNPEIYFGDNFQYSLWVEFQTNNFETWYGCFGKFHQAGFNTVIASTDNNSALVVCGGRGFIVDINRKSIKLTFPDHVSIDSAVKTEFPEYFVVGACYLICVSDSDKIIAEVEPDRMLDGIYLKGSNKMIVFGEAASAENQYAKNKQFQFNLEDLSFQFVPDKRTSFTKKFLKLFGG